MNDDIVVSEFEITDEEVALLNASRTLLMEIAKRANAACYDYGNLEYTTHAEAASFGRLAERAEAAEHSTFQMLNLINAHRLAPLTQDQLHNRVSA